MKETLILVWAWAAGVGLGAVFFGALRWTTIKGASSARPALWSVGSLLFRSSVILVGFYIVGSFHWERYLACLLGFFMARSVLARLTRPSAEFQRRSPEADPLDSEPR